MTDHTSDILFKDLRLLFCGMEECEPLHSWGPVVRPNYIIHYILRGKGIYQVGNEVWHLGEKEGFLIEPETLTFYQADKSDPWTYCWIGFDGELAAQITETLGLNPERLIFYCDQKDELEQIIRNLLKYNHYSHENRIMLESQLYMFFAVLMKHMAVNDIRRSIRQNDYVNAAIQYIRDNYNLPVKINDVAEYVGINRSYLYTLFHEETGMSPREYLTNFRLTRAAEMLGQTRYTIESVAFSCGYPDPVVFSKTFKQKYKLTPLQFRKRAERDQKSLRDNLLML